MSPVFKYVLQKRRPLHIICLGMILSFFIIKYSFSQEVKEIKILHANTIEFDEATGITAKRLIGNVEIAMSNAFMFCDSAYYYSEEKIVDAFSNVHVIRADTLHLYGDYMKYDGNDSLVEVRENVVLIDRDTRLTTEALDYNIETNIAYYLNHGRIESGENILTSTKGYYYGDYELFVFSDSVVIINPDYTVNSDSLKYLTLTKVAYFLAPTEIYNEENYIYCENGYYDTENKIFSISQNALIREPERTLFADSIFFNDLEGYGNAKSNVEIIDTSHNVTLKGNYAEYYQDPEKSMMTDSALLIQVFEEDTFFVHADTLKSGLDSLGHKLLFGYYKVKIFKSNMQGKCDSIFYSDYDSITELHGTPVLWSGENQITANYIELINRNNKIDRLELYETAFIISREDSSRYNQIKGKKMTGYFNDDNELYKINVIGNGQTIYYPKDGDVLIGVNKGECTNMDIYIRERKPYKILYLTKPDATLYPLGELSEKELKLKDFIWLEEYRPYSRDDIFFWKK